MLLEWGAAKSARTFRQAPEDAFLGCVQVIDLREHPAKTMPLTSADAVEHPGAIRWRHPRPGLLGAVRCIKSELHAFRTGRRKSGDGAPIDRAVIGKDCAAQRG